MSWLKKIFSFPEPNYKVKPGFLVPSWDGDVYAAELYLYNNGICIVKSMIHTFEATETSPSNYKVNSKDYPRFIVTE